MTPSFTFALLKPDAVANPIVLKNVSDAIYKSGLVVTKGCKMRMTHDQAENLYSIHRGKFFYSRLIRHVRSGPVIAMRLQIRSLKNQEASKKTEEISDQVGKKSLLEWLFQTKDHTGASTIEQIADLDHEEVIRRWRRLLGPSKVFANCYKVSANFADNDFSSLRNFFALSDTRNCGHGSDSSTELIREYAIFKEFLVDVEDDADLFELNKMVLEAEGEFGSNL